ncbi:MAG: BlaI/MecI/CopY family transcriptional regulator [Vicinamibacterales bacterium]|nr:BlaI/MecI/CopY family transcriptional regulator [Vicinamibacterales bacterium]MDP7672451.1 BlaI/MecI/CopY family transcriptional regulator [Vicinamibacterales bacterium]HJO38526.1 BlaI/MecI/CopY family transcriptional regulator [Vicinamibacterales bacterium]
MIGAAQLRSRIYEEVEHDPKVTRQAVAVVLIASVGAGGGGCYVSSTAGVLAATTSGTRTRRMAETRGLTRRERQIMDIVYRRGRASAAEVMEDLPDPPSYSATRALLRILEEKGHVRHEQQGPRYVFLPVVAPDKARRSALKQVVQTFFGGSTSDAVAALLDMPSRQLSKADRARLSAFINQARKEGR